MTKFDIQDEYNYRLAQVARLIASCGEDESRAADISVDELMGILAGHYYPDGIGAGPSTDAEKQLHRIWYRTKEQARANCYYRDVLTARMV